MVDKVQQHIQTVGEALHIAATTSGNKRDDALRRLEENAEGWLEQSIELLEQQQREIERLRAALIAERDDAMTWDGIGTVNRINAVLSPNKEVSPPIDYKARYEALLAASESAVSTISYLTGEYPNEMWTEQEKSHWEEVGNDTIKWIQEAVGYGEVSTDVRNDTGVR